MPDFFKKMKKKVDKKKMSGGDKMGSKDKTQRRLKFLPFQASTTSMFFRRKGGDSAECDGEYLGKLRSVRWVYFYFPFPSFFFCHR